MLGLDKLRLRLRRSKSTLDYLSITDKIVRQIEDLTYNYACDPVYIILGTRQYLQLAYFLSWRFDDGELSFPIEFMGLEIVIISNYDIVTVVPSIEATMGFTSNG